MKMKCFENNDRSGKFKNRMLEDSKVSDEDPRSENPYADFFSLSDNDIKNFEGIVSDDVAAPKKKRRKKKASKKNLEDLME